MTDKTTFQVEQWSIDKFIPYARNPRKNDGAVERRISSIRECGYKIPPSQMMRLDREHMRCPACGKDVLVPTKGCGSNDPLVGQCHAVVESESRST